MAEPKPPEDPWQIAFDEAYDIHCAEGLYGEEAALKAQEDADKDVSHADLR